MHYSVSHTKICIVQEDIHSWIVFVLWVNFVDKFKKGLDFIHKSEYNNIYYIMK